MTDDDIIPLDPAYAEHPDHPYKFRPVPRRTTRADGWTSDRQHCFVWALARIPSVTVAARAVGMSARSAYRLRDAAGAEAFAAAWDDAMEIGADRVRETAIERTLEGVEVAIVRRGRVIGTETRYDHRLLAAVLNHGVQEKAGLTALMRRIEYRRQVRAADAKYGKYDADGPAKRAAAEEAAQSARHRAELKAWREARDLAIEEARRRPGYRAPLREVGGRITPL